jgi:hypothetical protein
VVGRTVLLPPIGVEANHFDCDINEVRGSRVGQGHVEIFSVYNCW